jgi:hypothetical protein
MLFIVITCPEDFEELGKYLDVSAKTNVIICYMPFYP